MRIAVPFENEEIFQHFGHTKHFKIYNLLNGTVISSAIIDSNGGGHSKLGAFLKANGVDILICGGIGQGARNALQQAEIALFPGASGSADKAVEAYLEGNLVFNPSFTCDHHDHHDHHEDHDCHCHE